MKMFVEHSSILKFLKNEIKYKGKIEKYATMSLYFF